MAARSKASSAVMAALKEKLEAGNPTEVLEKVEALQRQHEALMEQQHRHNRGVATLTLALDWGTMRYTPAMSGASSVEDLKALQGVLRHYQEAILDPEVLRLEVEAEVLRRMEPEKESGEEQS